MTLYRKIGGIHWFAIGPVRISICLVRAKRGSAQAPRPRPTTAQKLAWVRAAIDGPGVEMLRPSSDYLVSEACRGPGGLPTPTSVPEGLEAQGDEVTTDLAGNIVPFKPSQLVPMPTLPRISTFPWPPEAKV